MRFTFAFPRLTAQWNTAHTKGWPKVASAVSVCPFAFGTHNKIILQNSICQKKKEKKGNVKIESKWKFKWKSPTQAHSIECETSGGI